ncbi:MAG: selenium cofactor biosynthesis protein YqeC [Lachnospiraceae bacterium]
MRRTALLSDDGMSLQEVGSLYEALPFLREMGHFVSLVGGGGKTTLMYEMAAITASHRTHTVVTTTTHIWKPADRLPAETEQEIWHAWKEGQFAVCGAPSGADKLTIPDQEWMNRLIEIADFILAESDGAKGMPAKSPREHEPVISRDSDIVVGVLGLDAVGRPIKEVCFGIEEMTKLLQKQQDETFTEEDAVMLLTSEMGSRKSVQDREYYVILNKWDRMSGKVSILNLLQSLRNQGVSSTIVTGQFNEK